MVKPHMAMPTPQSPMQPVCMPHSSLAQPSAQPAPHSVPSPAGDGFVVLEDVLLNFQRCDRRAFLDIYGDYALKDPPSDYLMKLHQDSLGHQRSVISDHPVVIPTYPHRDWEAGAAATRVLMQQGADRIANGVLRTVRPDGTVLVSRPKLLIKEPGQSEWGDWRYYPADIKLGKRAKSDYQVIAAYHAFVLADSQGAWPEASLLILRHQNVYEVDLFEQVPKMMTILHDCLTMLQQRTEPQVFIARNRCDLCHWFSHCYQQAKQETHLSLLPGVTANRYVHLQALNLTTVEALAATSPQNLGDLPGFGRHVAQKIVRQAQAVQQQRALLTEEGEQQLQQLLTHARSQLQSPIARAAAGTCCDRSISDSSAMVNALLPTAPVELYFDIEAAPERELIYLHGVLAVDRHNQTQHFHALLAAHPEDEQKIWCEFLDLVLHQYPDSPIFHFCPYELQTIKKLADYYDTSWDVIEPLLERFVDIHDRVVELATLPIESYALKAIARWVGFDWRDEGANGAQSIYWYDQWIETGDRTFLDTILRYNEDDCRATWRVKDWLIDFLLEHLQTFEMLETE